MKPVHRAMVVFAILAVLLVAIGCGKDASGSPAAPSGGPPQGGGPPGGGRDSAIKQIMKKLDKGPNSLNTIDKGLKADQPAWETIQPQTADYAKLAADIGKSDPPKGDKDSWSKLTAAYAESAAALDRAAQSKDLVAAKAAHRKLATSCMECHQKHRGGPPGGGGGGPPQRPD
jgi:hypothetical protein